MGLGAPSTVFLVVCGNVIFLRVPLPLWSASLTPSSILNTGNKMRRVAHKITKRTMIGQRLYCTVRSSVTL